MDIDFILYPISVEGYVRAGRPPFMIVLDESKILILGLFKSADCHA